MDEQKPEDVSLAQELRELGRQIKEAVRVAREHPQTKEFERQVTQAVNQLGVDIDRAIRSAQRDEKVQKAGTQVKQAAETFTASSAGQDIERGLAKGMRALNEQIRRAIVEAEKQSRGPDLGEKPADQTPPPDAGKE
jgi:uncharacterized membrane-anchored protein YjiN (DUF445 family)